MAKPGQYDTAKVKLAITEMRRLLADKVTFDSTSATLIITNLVAGLESAVQTIEFIQDQMEFDTRERMSTGVKSDARH